MEADWVVQFRGLFRWDDMFLDRRICGMADGHIQYLLLLEITLTLAKAYIIAVAREMASRDAIVFNQTGHPPPPPPLVLMLSRLTWMLTKIRHHTNIVETHKQLCKFQQTEQCSQIAIQWSVLPFGR